NRGGPYMRQKPGSLLHLMPLDEAMHQINCCMALLDTLRSELQNSEQPKDDRIIKHQHLSLLEMALDEADRNIELAYPQWCEGGERRRAKCVTEVQIAGAEGSA